MKHLLPLAALLLSTAALPAQTLHVYGPGGPLAPMKECATLFQAKTGIPVDIHAGPEDQWYPAAEHDADLIFEGADYMLTQFDLHHPGFLQPASRQELYSRAAGILVRPGNPKHIQSLRDLTHPGIHLLNVDGAGQVGLWEDLAGRLNLIPAIQGNTSLTTANSADAIKAWDAHPELDAWITFASWAKRLPDKTTLVPLPEADRLYRGTPIALTARSTNSPSATQFVQFLTTPQAHAVFQKWGWR